MNFCGVELLGTHPNLEEKENFLSSKNWHHIRHSLEEKTKKCFALPELLGFSKKKTLTFRSHRAKTHRLKFGLYRARNKPVTTNYTQEIYRSLDIHTFLNNWGYCRAVSYSILALLTPNLGIFSYARFAISDLVVLIVLFELHGLVLSSSRFETSQLRFWCFRCCRSHRCKNSLFSFKT